MRTNWVLVDYENVQVASLALLSEEHFRVKMFLGPNNSKLQRELVLSMHKLGSRASYVAVETSGRNSLDFHIAYYLGLLAATEPTAFFHIISRDTGFDPLIKHLKADKILAARSPSIAAMPCFKSPQTASPAATPAVSLIDLALADLISRKATKPRTIKSLTSTLHAKLGKNRPISDVKAVLKALVTSGYITIDGTKVLYALPTKT